MAPSQHPCVCLRNEALEHGGGASLHAQWLYSAGSRNEEDFACELEAVHKSQGLVENLRSFGWRFVAKCGKYAARWLLALARGG